MPYDPRLSAAAANASADAVCALLDGGGVIRIFDDGGSYGGGAQNYPLSVADAIVGNVLLAEIQLNADAFAAAVAGVASLNLPVTDEDSAPASGTARFFRAYRYASPLVDPDDAIFQGLVGEGGSDLNIISVDITVGMPVVLSSFTYTQNLA